LARPRQAGVVYSTCLFCHSNLGRNEVIEAFPVGRRLAFDADRGRLWVVCRGCQRWNLTPIEERWEAIEVCERLFRSTRVRVSTDNVGLAALSEGLELVRIGAPLRPEFAAWRYGANFKRRRRRAALAAGIGAVATAAVAPMLLPAVVPALPLGGLLALGGAWAPAFVPPGIMLLDAAERWKWDRVVARVPGSEGGLLRVRAKHLWGSAMYLSANDDTPALRLLHDGGVEQFEGRTALSTSGKLLARANWLGAASGLVRRAVERIETIGDASSYLVATAERFTRFRGRRLMGEYRRIGALSLAPIERLALEMAVHEESERRALQGELTALADEWKRAEEIAAIADRLPDDEDT
jgi:hypothetical protein